jgi:histidinol-phosphatase (PHP family)
VHYLKIGDEYIPVDENAELLRNAAEKHFDGDIYKLCELYYETVSDVVNRTECSIIGHFDLITKFIEKDKLFDESNPRYIAAWKKALDRLLETGKVFEINTGAVSRGYRTLPYPSSEIIAYIKQNGGKLILSSDAHSAENIGFDFEKYEKYIDDVMLEL